MQPETQYAKSGNAHIAYQVIGEGPVDVLLVPHFFHHVELWWDCRHRRRFTEALASFARVILFDKRGTGLSDRTCGVPPFDVQMDDVRAVLDAAGSHRAVLWAATDGSPMVLLFAATFPERAEGLVLWDPHPTFIRNPEMPWLMTHAEFDEAVRETARSLEDREAAFLAEAMPSLATDEERREFWRVCRLGTSPGDHLAFTSVLADTDVRHILPAIRVPTLVLTNAALSDRHDTTRYVAERIPTARLSILPGHDRTMLVGELAPLIHEVREFVEQIRAMPPEAADRVLATVLFTDIVGSTERAVELGDREWHDLVERHHGLVRSQLARFRGKEIDTAGDGFFATFDGPARAIHCARAIADSVRELGIEIRAGLHTGEVELAEERPRGIAVHIGARVSARAEPGEVLVSNTVKDLVAGSGIEFEERDTAELKGVPGEWRLFAVRD
ncbi:MAG TPA: adenylate/guanylate cyclase domain-containing protein [Gaiellaceae bacterium]|nr:adenylate/guanylate cyclase domain-containing protein [Gaiellaceae bacterium]